MTSVFPEKLAPLPSPSPLAKSGERRTIARTSALSHRQCADPPAGAADIGRQAVRVFSGQSRMDQGYRPISVQRIRLRRL